MTHHPLTLALAALLAAPATAQDGPLAGTPALAGAPAGVSGTLTVEETGALDRSLELSLFDAATGEPVTDFDEELTKELHVIGTDSAFTTFVHEHAETAEADGRFRLDVPFPAPGLYHLYMDMAPTGLGQQVLRFYLPVGEAPAVATPPVPQEGDLLTATAGPYSVELDVSDLRAGEDSAVALRILANGAPAQDLEPYLGVPAHAVFIDTATLSYVHAHATAAGEGHGAHAGHGIADMEGTPMAPEAMPEDGAEAHGHAGHAMDGMPAMDDAAVPADLGLQVTPPAPGTYALWIQFIGAGEVRTAPFVIAVE
jgi:hypothetical protein